MLYFTSVDQEKGKSPHWSKSPRFTVLQLVQRNDVRVLKIEIPFLCFSHRGNEVAAAAASCRPGSYHCEGWTVGICRWRYRLCAIHSSDLPWPGINAVYIRAVNLLSDAASPSCNRPLITGNNACM